MAAADQEEERRLNPFIVVVTPRRGWFRCIRALLLFCVVVGCRRRLQYSLAVLAAVCAFVVSVALTVVLGRLSVDGNGRRLRDSGVVVAVDDAVCPLAVIHLSKLVQFIDVGLG